VAEEYAQTIDDVLWRRTKCGLHMEESEREAVEQHLRRRSVAVRA
jgi:glycerol-3-phosphate dehydrogenase